MLNKKGESNELFYVQKNETKNQQQISTISQLINQDDRASSVKYLIKWVPANKYT